MCETKSFSLWVSQIVALLGLLVLLLWLSLRPKQPSFTIIDFYLPTSPANQLGDNSTLSFELEIQNPNQNSGIFYDDTLLTFSYGEDTLGQKTIPSFHQKKGRKTRMFEHVVADLHVWKKVVGIIISKASAELKVDVVTTIQYQMWGRRSKHHGFDLHGRLPIGSDGKISGKKKKIVLRHRSMKWRKKKGHILHHKYQSKGF